MSDINFDSLNEIEKLKLFFDRLNKLKDKKMDEIPMEDKIEMVLLMGETNMDEDLKSDYKKLKNRNKNLNYLLKDRK